MDEADLAPTDRDLVESTVGIVMRLLGVCREEARAYLVTNAESLGVEPGELALLIIAGVARRT